MARRGMGSSQAGLRKKQRAEEAADDLRVKRERLRQRRRARREDRSDEQQSEQTRKGTSSLLTTGDRTREPIIIRHGGKEIEV